eukprot:6208412-Pleurochrysis_carterae.AAC.1
MRARCQARSRCCRAGRLGPCPSMLSTSSKSAVQAACALAGSEMAPKKSDCKLMSLEKGVAQSIHSRR